MTASKWPGIVAVALLSGCDKPPAPSPFQAVANVKQLMAGVLEPAADLYWDAVGTVDDQSGSKAHAPATPEEWTAVRNSAYVIAESGNLLLMGNRLRDQGDWLRMSQALVVAGRHALAAAESRNTTAVFDAGAEVYDACTKCHAVYVNNTK